MMHEGSFFIFSLSFILMWKITSCFSKRNSTVSDILSCLNASTPAKHSWHSSLVFITSPTSNFSKLSQNYIFRRPLKTRKYWNVDTYSTTGTETRRDSAVEKYEYADFRFFQQTMKNLAHAVHYDVVWSDCQLSRGKTNKVKTR